MSCKERLTTSLERAAVPYEFHHHPRAYTAQEVAEREHVPGNQVAKVVMILANERLAMLVTRATDQVDLSKAARVLEANDAQLAHEGDFAAVFPDCEVGAMPAFGNLYGLPVVVDRALSSNEEILSQAGTHADTVKVRYQDFQRLVHPLIADITRPVSSEA
jgi:Ala-tRNA(Pro) deacylase